MGPSVGLIAMQADDEQLDDWLGTISDDDWDEGAIARAGLRRAMPADQEPADAEDDARRDAASDRAAADDALVLVDGEDGAGGDGVHGHGLGHEAASWGAGSARTGAGAVTSSGGLSSA